MRSLASTLAVSALAISGAAADWPQWRGPLGIGVSTEAGLPTEWTPAQADWRTPLGGLGVSSPIVWGDRIFVTGQLGRGRLRTGREHRTLGEGPGAPEEKSLGATTAAVPEGSSDAQFVVEALHRDDGRRLWEYRFDTEGELPGVHRKINLASPSPTTDGERVYALFGNGQLVALDVAGRPVWQRHLGQEIAPFDISWGHAGSPTVFEDLLILLCDHRTDAYLLALDKTTGKQRWRVPRTPGEKSYATPIVIAGPRGHELIVNSTPRVESYDPRTGELLWWAGGRARSAVGAPAFHDGVLFMSRGHRSGPYMAVRMGGRGDVNETHVEWLVETGAPYISSLLYYEGLVYMANGRGIVTCIDPATGEKVWQERVGGVFAASPVGADGKVYLVIETGEVVVLAAGKEPRVLARNRLEGRSLATPAISGGQIFIRTDGHVVSLGGDR